MPDMKLFIINTGCTRVTLTALEQIGVSYQVHMLDPYISEQRSAEYLAINPHGKVPCLQVDGRVMTENVAILRWLHASFPDAGLFPFAATPWEESQQLAPLVWISSAWHPTVRAIKVPFLWTKGEEEPVKAKGEELFSQLLDQLDRELDNRRWWFGDRWSIVDTYFWWAYINSEFGGFDLGPWKNVARHRADLELLPQLHRALEREEAALLEMQARGGTIS